MGRFVPITVTTVAGAEKPNQFSVTGGKGYYDGKQCWQYKVVYDRPGTYTYTLPATAICARTVLVGGGGKPKCGSVVFDGSSCNSAAGAGGAYSDKCHVSTGSPVFTLVVGRQEQDTTLACNSVAVHTAGGAAGYTPGAASGGDWNSRGGCSGYTCNYCGGSYSHYCGSCKCFVAASCCGYCYVMQYTEGEVGGSACCNMILAGGASAGGPRNLCGGCSSILCGNCHSGVAGGGGGLGSTCVNHVWHYPCCSCICFAPASPQVGRWCIQHPPSVQGGYGTIKADSQQCRSTPYQCIYGIWKSGDGGPGGPDSNAGHAWQVEWGYAGMCAYPFGVQCWNEQNWTCTEQAPCRVDWWDISDICGTGSPGTGMFRAMTGCYGSGMIGPRPKNSGEGAGTGGIMTYCCNPNQFGNMLSGGATSSALNWLKICNLGLTGQCDQAWLMQDSLFPFFITCAGTLGGSGGVAWCTYTSKAGKGGGGGQAKCQFLCICHGGSYDTYNNSGGTPLAFPPCLLDQLVSNAGTGMAIIYYREA